ncbi:hypothetical protein BH11MYX3_BH11MYX3_41350 [soil metagenome]
MASRLLLVGALVMPLFEAFLIIDQPRQRLSHWCAVLSPLDDPSAPPLTTATVHYDPTMDQALIGLRYDAIAVGEHGLGFLVELALLAEIGMVQPAELSEGDRGRFVGDRLTRCTIQITEQRHVTSALTELVRRIREARASRSAMSAPLPLPLPPPPLTPAPRASSPVPPPLPAAALRRVPRGDTSDPHLLVKAKGTRDNLGTSRATGSDRMAPVTEGRAVSPNVISRTSVHRAETVEMPPDDVSKRVAESIPPPRSGAVIYARYLRSGRGLPIRIGALSLKGAALLAGALPRINDHVDVALSFGGHRALVRGNVGKISTVDEVAMSGASTFSVDFKLDDASRRQLTSLLTAARDAKITIKPPPPRAARRFPVEWPMGLGTTRGVVRADALDVSRDGMFVRPLHALTLNSLITFSAMLDDGEPAAAGRARVIRHIGETEARAGGLAAGYGLNITEMSEVDRERWSEFIARVERRAQRRILIGASPARLVEIQACLAAAGYAVTGGTDPGALVQLASAEARPVDAALIDAGWLAPSRSGEWVESLFSARNVPCVTLHGDAKRARVAVDKLFELM